MNSCNQLNILYYCWSFADQKTEGGHAPYYWSVPAFIFLQNQSL